MSMNTIVESYTAILPSVQRKLLFEQIHVPKKNITWRRKGKRMLKKKESLHLFNQKCLCT